MTRAINVVAATLAMVTLTAPPLFAQGASSPHGAQDMQQQPKQQGGPPQGGRQDRQSRVERMLEDRVYVRLAEEAWAGGDFDVQVQNNTVTLSGTVPSEQAKQRMLRITRRTFGITDVRDQLKVNPSVATPPTTTVDDRVLAQRVAQQIARAIPGAKTGEDWWMTGWRVEGPDNRWTFTVEAENGNVWLDGEVPRHSYVREAINAARQTQGVRSVRSNLELERDYYWRGWGYYPGYASRAYGPYAYDTDYYFVDVGDDVNAHGFRGLHAVTGEVTTLDKQKGTLALRTQEGTLQLRFPPRALQGVSQGDRITVELGMKPAGAAGAASPRTEVGTQQQSRSPGQK